MGVRSNTRAILKMTNCTFTYPGRSKPSLYNVSCALSLSRWDHLLRSVVILTTLTCDPPMQSGRYHRTQWCWQVYAHQAPDCASSISSCCQSWSDVSCLLQGETEPQEGTVYKHPALRIGYVSQHATHHIGMNGHICQDHPLLIISRIAERHLEKTPIQYIQWRFQDGHDRMYLFQASLRCWIARTRRILTVALSRRDLGEGHSRSHGRRQGTA